MIGRGLAAVLFGVAASAVLNSLIIALVLNDFPLSPASFFLGVVLVAIYGVFLTAPAWLLFCLMLLPVATHRVRIGRDLSRRFYLAVAFVLGAVLIVPLFLLCGFPVEMMWLAPLLGGVGGLSIAAMWSFLILDIVQQTD